jgi:uncharacterized protein (DUF58 family)
MGSKYLVLVLFIVAAAALAQVDAALTPLYLLVGAYAAGRFWSRRAMAGVQFRRIFTNRVFLGEKIPVRLELTNVSHLPVVWLRLRESLPVGVGMTQYQQVVTLPGRGKRVFDYLLQPTKRGYYQIGPLSLYSGDVLGMLDDQRREGPPDHLTVYPRIVALTRPRMPSRTPIGSLRHTQPIYEDPNRVFGKRDYQAGDSLRRIDWKSSASVGRLQVKQFEPSISLEMAILLDLSRTGYDAQRYIDATELAIVAAASLANWAIGRKQSAALATNGLDPLGSGETIEVPMRKGRGHLMRILDVLARIEAGDTAPCVEMLRRERSRLGWGTTAVVITGKAGDALFDELFAAQRAGLNMVLILCGPAPNFDDIRRRAERFGIVALHARNERDLDTWRE